MVWFLWEPMGLFLSAATWALLLFANWVIFSFVLLTWFPSETSQVPLLGLTDGGLAALAVYQFLMGLSWVCHFRAMTTDPGTVPVAKPPSSVVIPRTCKICNGCWKPARAHHCKTCERCIFRMDHHCPWINNCVGHGNQKYFVLFLGYTGVLAGATFVVLLLSAICWLASLNTWKDAAPPGNACLIASGLVAIESLAAMLFVADFLGDQVECIQSNSTLVETYQRTHGRQTTTRQQCEEIFGRNILMWPFPVATAPAPDYLEPVFPDADAQGSAMVDYGVGIAGAESELVGQHEEADVSKREASENTARLRHQAAG